MFSIFKKRESIKEVVDPRPPVGAMFEEDDIDDRFLIVTKHLDLPEHDYLESMRVEFFPQRSHNGMKMSLSYLKGHYKRLSPEKEKEWQEKYFKDRDGFFAKEAEEQYQKGLRAQDANVARHEAYYKMQSKSLEKKIDTTKEKFIVIYSGSCDVLESLLNRAAKKGFKVIFTSHTEEHWFMAVLEKK